MNMIRQGSILPPHGDGSRRPVIEHNRKVQTCEPGEPSGAGRAALKRHTSVNDVAERVLAFCRADTVTGQASVIDGGLVFH